MAKRKNRVKVNIPMCLAAILFCLTLLSIHFMGGLYARYTTSASGGDSARVASFGELTITETGDFYEDNKMMIIPGVDLNKKATVNFTGSEMATYVFVEIKTSPQWKLAEDKMSFSIVMNSAPVMQWSVAEGWNYLLKDGETYVYYREVAPNAALDNVNLISEDGKITVSDNITKKNITSMTDIAIEFSATVVQLGGFESAESAWNSIAAKGGM